MTSITNSIFIKASVDRIYELASATEHWPQILPHYRYVRLVSAKDCERTVEMGARRGPIPVSWTAQQRNDPATPAIYFRHIRGWTKGMNVVWQFNEGADGTNVSIVHDLDFRFPVAAKLLEKYVICGFFVHGIAANTLRCVKRLAENARVD
jgi:ribosome-associated toxin RatA of RatAB toxin-antitoxin module